MYISMYVGVAGAQWQCLQQWLATYRHSLTTECLPAGNASQSNQRPTAACYNNA